MASGQKITESDQTGMFGTEGSAGNKVLPKE
jgi:hypothetical protein